LLRIYADHAAAISGDAQRDMAGLRQVGDNVFWHVVRTYGPERATGLYEHAVRRRGNACLPARPIEAQKIGSQQYGGHNRGGKQACQLQ
jgi:hypothetical protein